MTTGSRLVSILIVVYLVLLKRSFAIQLASFEVTSYKTTKSARELPSCVNHKYRCRCTVRHTAMPFFQGAGGIIGGLASP